MFEHFTPPPLETIMDPTVRSSFVFAHQDDELQYAGLLYRLRTNSRFLWVTNGDGLGPMERIDPYRYAAIRLAECAAAMRVVGVGPEQVTDLETSEIENYNHFIDWAAEPRNRPGITAYFTGMARKIYEFLADWDPVNVFVMAYQGGNPEHDIASAFTGLSLRLLARQRRKQYNLVHLPEYEFTILVPMRFKPWYKGPIYSYRVTEHEQALKVKVMEAYASQKKLIANFRNVMNTVGTITSLVGRGFDYQSIGAMEHLGPVPLEFDYLRNTHALDKLNYINDCHRGRQISFEHMIKPIVASVWEQMETW